MCSAFVLGDSVSSCLVLQEGVEGRRREGCKEQQDGGFPLDTSREITSGIDKHLLIY